MRFSTHTHTHTNTHEHTQKSASGRELSPGAAEKPIHSGDFVSGAMSSDRVECKAEYARNRIYVIAINGATRRHETTSSPETDNCQTKDADDDVGH